MHNKISSQWSKERYATSFNEDQEQLKIQIKQLGENRYLWDAAYFKKIQK